MGGLPCIKEELCNPPVRHALDKIRHFTASVESNRIPLTDAVAKAIYGAVEAEEAAADMLNKAFANCMSAAAL